MPSHDLIYQAKRNGPATASPRPVPPEKGKPTSLLLLQSQLSPIGLHAVAQGHPDIGLLLRRHLLPATLDVGEGRVGDGVGGTGLDGAGDDGRAHGGADGAGDGSAEHCGGVCAWWEDVKESEGR
jgi:hypothetical protein